jgi:hypothetical protein
VTRALGVLIAVLAHARVPVAGAEVHYPAPGSIAGGRATGLYMGGLTPESDWSTILKTRGIRVELPLVRLGGMFVPASALCITGYTMRVADPRMDRGFRLAVPQPRRDGWPHHAVTYGASVYYMIQTGNSPWLSFLFNKAWEVPGCATP